MTIETTPTLRSSHGHINSNGVVQEGVATDRASFHSFVGVALHKCSVTLAAVGFNGDKIAAITIDTKCINKIEQWLLALPKPVWMAVEAVGFAEWFLERISTLRPTHRYRRCDRTGKIAGKTPQNRPKRRH